MTQLRPVASEWSASVTARAPAKVNVQLSVGPQRKDGYHDLVNVFQALSLYDEVTIRRSASGGIRIRVEGEGADVVPIDETNLVWQAIEVVASIASVRPDVDVLIRKQIPVAAGLAGGSADGAAALLAAIDLLDAEVERAELDDLARGLGADVPFVLHGGTAVGTGRGDQLTSALARGTFHWVLAFADRGLSTPAVFARLDEVRGAGVAPAARLDESVMTALRTGDAGLLGRSMSNDLQTAAIRMRPALGTLLELGVECGALGGVISGSGPTCAFLTTDDEAAIALAVELSASGTCRAVRRVHGPVAGARLVHP